VEEWRCISVMAEADNVSTVCWPESIVMAPVALALLRFATGLDVLLVGPRGLSVVICSFIR
jgi:hypothetical protein